MKNIITEQRVGSYLLLGTLLLTIVSFIIYGCNVSGPGYFHSRGVSEVVLFSILAILLIVGLLVLSQFHFDGILGKVVSICSGALKVLIPCFLAIALMSFISGRVEGLAYIYFSDPNILDTIQAPETGNLVSAHTAIAGFIFYALTIILSLVTAFFSLGRKEETAEAKEVA